MTGKKYSEGLGFTLVELMVVIAIIGILATLIMVTLDNTKSTARNTRRLADIKQLQLALKMYYNDNGTYPTAITAGSSIALRGVNYLLRVPENPKPWNDGTCPNQDYQYRQFENGQRYSISFCVSDATDDLLKGPKLATANGVLNCPAGYIGIPGSAALETNDFCVMKYEAKCANTTDLTTGLTTPVTANNTYNNSTTPCTGSRSVVSTSSGYPIANINQVTAQAYCQAAGGHLITNAEWMTIARDIEQLGSSWLGGTYGSGYLSLGHYNLAAGTVLDGSEVLSGGVFYGKTSPQSYDHIYKREFTLSTGEKIFDLSGNVAEWVSDTCTAGTADGQYDATGHEWRDASLTYERSVAGPTTALCSAPSPWCTSSGQGIGLYGGCTTGSAFLRGGRVNGGYNVGIYDLDLSRNPTSYTNTLVGFRCVK